MVRFAVHAAERCKERQVTSAMIEWVLSHPVGGPDAGDFGKLAYSGYVQGGRKPVLKVVVDAADKEMIISVMWKDSI